MCICPRCGIIQYPASWIFPKSRHSLPGWTPRLFSISHLHIKATIQVLTVSLLGKKPEYAVSKFHERVERRVCIRTFLRLCEAPVRTSKGILNEEHLLRRPSPLRTVLVSKAAYLATILSLRRTLPKITLPSKRFLRHVFFFNYSDNLLAPQWQRSENRVAVRHKSKTYRQSAAICC